MRIEKEIIIEEEFEIDLQILKDLKAINQLDDYLNSRFDKQTVKAIKQELEEINSEVKK